MKDITKKFFEEIYPKYHNLKLNDEIIVKDKKFSGRIAVLAVKGREKVESLNCLISKYGFKPIVLEFEESLKLKGRVKQKLKNVDILINNPKGNPVHNFSGNEKAFFERSLGSDGLLINCRYSTKRLEPKKVLDILLIYLNDNPEEYSFLLNDADENVPSSKVTLSYPVDIKEKIEFQNLISQFNFVKGLTDIRLINSSCKNSRNKSTIKKRISSQKVLFTFVHKDCIEINKLKIVKKQIDQIFKQYNRGDLKAKVQVVIESTSELVAA